MATDTITSRAPRQALGRDARAIAWWALVGAAAGAIAGLLVGGIGGRLAMLLLRLTSPDDVIGMTSDDGFEIGVATADTLNLFVGMAAAGGVNGVLYAALRGWFPRRLRLPLWVAVSGSVVGALVVHEDGVDFTLLEPVALAVASFVALPAVAAGLVVVLVERWADREPFADTRLTAFLGAASLCGTAALAMAAAASCVALVGRRSGATARLEPVARVVVPGAVAAVALVAAAGLARETARLL